MFKHKRSADDFAEEIKAHLELEADELRRGGLDDEEARRQARITFGSVPAAQERFYLRNRVAWFDTLLRDLRFAVRQLARNPAFAASAILVLALGIGVSVAIFGFVNAALLKPLPYPASNRLMAVNENAVLWPRSPLSVPDYLDWKRLNHSFSSLDAYHQTGYLLRTSSGAEPVKALRVSDGFFSTLGVRPILGRNFLPGEDRPAGPPIAILSYRTWLRRFGGSPNIVGKSVDLSGDDYTIIGVLPGDFAFAPQGDTEFWVPLGKLNHCEQRRGCHNLWGIGRLRDGVSIQAARAEMKAIAKQLERQYPVSNRDQGASVVPFSEVILGNVRPVILTLFGAAGLLLLIACVNVASLLLVRSESRKHEVALRSALGATTARLAGQFVTESLLLTGLGVIAGVFVASGLMRLLTRLVPKDMAAGMPFLARVGLDLRTIAFPAGVALVSVLLLAATPSLRLSFQDLREGLAEAGRTSVGRFWSRMGSNLVVAELAIAVVLLAGAGLLAKSFYRLVHAPMNFEPSHLATIQIETPQNAYSKDTQLISLYQEIIHRVSALPGVRSAALASDPPVTCNCDTDWLRFVGKPFHGEHNEVNQREISPAYLSTLKASLIRGRLFTDADNASRPNVIIVNQALARKYFPGEDPIGKKVGDDDLSPDSIRQIIGVVSDIREGALDTDIWPAEYQPLYQSQSPDFNLLVRASNDEAALLPSLVKTIHQIDPNLGVRDEQTMTEHIGSTPAALLHSFSTWLVGGFAAMALVLGAVGLYGVIAYSVSQRTREIGIRMALGAQRASVYSLVMRQAGWLTATGLIVGLVCSVGTSLLIRDLLFGVHAWDAATLAAVAALLAVVALAATFVPARRAASVNPVEALRSE